MKQDELLSFIETSLAHVDHSISVNKRKDGLYHSYNLAIFNKGGVSIRYLYEMLEGQVAVLSSGYLNAIESLEVLDALKSSTLFREDQYSYILYPDRQLTRFEDKNIIPEEKVKSSAIIQRLLKESKTGIIAQDDNGACHFNSKQVRQREEE